jgi:hypothetical protein
MFFSISQQHKNNFSYFYKLGPFPVSTDAGWNFFRIGQYHCLYKGYADSNSIVPLLDEIIHQTEPRLLGNFCVLVYNSDSNTLKIKTDKYRSFPIYYDTTGVTNLLKTENTAWADSQIEINPDLSIAETKFNIVGEIDATPLTVDQVIEKVNAILEEKTQNFIKYADNPIKTFLSGGVDSLLVYSYLQRYTDEFELVKCQHIDYDEFWLKNSGTLKSYWAYSQIHHWNDPCILTSGAPGDEFMLRSPTTINMFVRHYNKSVLDLLESPPWNASLHYTYFKRDKNLEGFAQPIDSTLSKEKLFWEMCNIVVNDWQHWHLGNTLTWTPLRDLEIFKLFLRLPVEQSWGQIFDSEISKKLIEKNKPGLTQLISDQKNSGNPLKNLCEFYGRN